MIEFQKNDIKIYDVHIYEYRGAVKWDVSSFEPPSGHAMTSSSASLRRPKCFCWCSPVDRIELLVAAVHESVHVLVFGRRHDEPFHALWRPASKKRQGTKSREVGHWLAASAMEN